MLTFRTLRIDFNRDFLTLCVVKKGLKRTPVPGTNYKFMQVLWLRECVSCFLGKRYKFLDFGMVIVSAFYDSRQALC